MKKFGAILLATLLVGSTMAGCSSKAGGSSSNKKVTIEFLNQKREAKDTFDALIKDFESKNPNITVKQTLTEDGATVFSTRAASGDFPQTFMTWPQNADVHQYEHDGFYLDLSTDKALNNIQSGIRKSAQYNGKDYTVPIALNTFGVFYNKQMFSDLGLSVPTTWSDFIAVCTKIKAAGKVAILTPDKDSWTGNQTMQAMMALNFTSSNPFLDSSKGVSKLVDSDAMKQVCQSFLDLRNYSQGNTLGLTYDDATNQFANGKAVMFIQGIWDIASIKKINPNLDFAMFPLPPLTGSVDKVPVGIDCGVAASSKAKDMSAVKKWLEYCTTTEAGQKYADLDGSPSAIKGVTTTTKEDQALLDIISAGKTIDWPGVYTTTNAKVNLDIGNNMPTYTQKLVNDKSISGYLTQLDSMVYGKAK